MDVFEKTQSTLNELYGDRQRSVGEHLSQTPKVSLFGVSLGEVLYDPSKHSLDDIDVFSLSETATGMPHVQMVLPRISMDIQIIEDRSTSDDDSRIARLKSKSNETLALFLANSKPGIKDRVRHFVISDSEFEEYNNLGFDSELIDARKGSEFVSESIASICLNGITFVISDFERLKVTKQTEDNFSKTIAIKSNHPAEISIPAGFVTLPLGNGRELDTSKPKELARFNIMLAERNSKIIKRLEVAGLAVASVVSAPNKTLGFDLALADESISLAISKISER
jgi:hypothetical protein